MRDPAAPLRQKRGQLVSEGYQKGTPGVLSNEGIAVGYGLDLIPHICNQAFSILEHLFEFGPSFVIQNFFFKVQNIFFNSEHPLYSDIQPSNACGLSNVSAWGGCSRFC